MCSKNHAFFKFRCIIRTPTAGPLFLVKIVRRAYCIRDFTALGIVMFSRNVAAIFVLLYAFYQFYVDFCMGLSEPWA